MTHLSISQFAQKLHVIDSADFKRFAELSGDWNPIHTDPEFASATPFKAVIAPGLLISAYISALIANELPGKGSIYLSQSLRFLRPVYHADEILVIVKVIELPRPGICLLDTTCLRSHDVVLSGEAKVKFSEP